MGREVWHEEVVNGKKDLFQSRSPSLAEKMAHLVDFITGKVQTD